MELLRCKACGYLIKESKLGDVCPACGVARKFFEPFHENFSKKRRIILGLDLHPIMMHFPQAFTPIIALFILLGVALDPVTGHYLLVTVRVLSVFLPLCVIGAFVCGLIDGKTRFKRLTTPSLVMKMSIGSIFIILSIAMAAVAVRYGTEYPGRLFLLLLSFGCIACQVALAQIGKTLINAKLPG